MNSTGADREQRRTRHTQRVAVLRAERERKPRTSVVSQLGDPFTAIQPDREMAAVEAVFPC